MQREFPEHQKTPAGAAGALTKDTLRPHPPESRQHSRPAGYAANTAARSKSSRTLHSWSVIPAATAGVFPSVEWTRTKLYAAKNKINVIFKGRENAHHDRGREMLAGIIETLSDVSSVERPPGMESGRQMAMTLMPKKG